VGRADGKELARIKDGIAIQGEEKLIVVHRNEKRLKSSISPNERVAKFSLVM
jgi:hypothetical protein